MIIIFVSISPVVQLQDTADHKNDIPSLNIVFNDYVIYEAFQTELQF